MSTKKKSKTQKAKRNERRSRPDRHTPHTIEVPRPWWINVGVFGLFMLAAMAWMAFCLWITSVYPDEVLSYVVFALPGAVSMALRPIPARRQILRWLALWLLFWSSLPIVSSAIYVIGSAWILKWAWDDEREKDATNPANRVLVWLRQLPAAVGRAWRKSGDEQAKPGDRSQCRTRRASSA